MSVYYHANLWSILGINRMKSRESTLTLLVVAWTHRFKTGHVPFDLAATKTGHVPFDLTAAIMGVPGTLPLSEVRSWNNWTSSLWILPWKRCKRRNKRTQTSFCARSSTGSSCPSKLTPSILGWLDWGVQGEDVRRVGTCCRVEFCALLTSVNKAVFIFECGTQWKV